MPHHVPSQSMSLPRAVHQPPLERRAVCMSVTGLFLHNPASQLSNLVIRFQHPADRKTESFFCLSRSKTTGNGQEQQAACFFPVHGTKYRLHPGGLSAGVLNSGGIASADHENGFCSTNGIASLAGIRLVQINAPDRRRHFTQKIGQQVGTGDALRRQESSHSLRELPDGVTRAPSVPPAGTKQ